MQVGRQGQLEHVLLQQGARNAIFKWQQVSLCLTNQSEKVCGLRLRNSADDYIPKKEHHEACLERNVTYIGIYTSVKLIFREFLGGFLWVIFLQEGLNFSRVQTQFLLISTIYEPLWTDIEESDLQT